MAAMDNFCLTNTAFGLVISEEMIWKVLVNKKQELSMFIATSKQNEKFV
jgi:hypothetical protein